MLYMVLQMPLGIVYFTLEVTFISVALSLMALPVVQIFWGYPVVDLGAGRIFLPYWELVLLAMGGFVLLTLTMHLPHAIGSLHGKYAKWMLVS